MAESESADIPAGTKYDGMDTFGRIKLPDGYDSGYAICRVLKKDDTIPADLSATTHYQVTKGGICFYSDIDEDDLSFLID